MKDKNWQLLLGLLVLFLPSCFSQKTYGDLIVINVLDKALYDDCHIKGSVQIPFDLLPQEAVHFDKHARIIIYCSNYRCTTSHYAARKLQQMGFDKVAVYEGGMADWFQKGYPVEGPHQKAYLQKKIEKIEHMTKVPTIAAEELACILGYSAA